MHLMWQQIASPIITEILCSGPFDGVVLDLEHGCFNPETTYSCIQVATLSKKKILVRLTHLDPCIVRMVLDAGVDGIILSTVETRGQAVDFVDMCLYGGCSRSLSKKNRGQGLVRENGWGEGSDALSDIRGARDKSLILIPQIETFLGVQSIDSIMEVYQFDYYMVGPYDLSASIGAVGDFESDEYRENILSLKKVCGEKLGYHIVKDIESQYEKLKGCQFLAFGMDTLFLFGGMKRVAEITEEKK